MSFKKVLIAVDDNPIAAHATDVGAELARVPSAEVAPIRMIDLAVAPDARIPAEESALLGSVAETVMRRAPCPVITVRAKE
ncbi:universal stress protein [Microvirga sp. M2]|uniref:universal stress protein n=1 Tax=Microvirga sp. M2 TaxID=3073270 RepID=UPI0039C488FD